ncbi:MAG TPA: hypothetical protein VF212_12830 [Longimicrobiales bacterium]
MRYDIGYEPRPRRVHRRIVRRSLAEPQGYGREAYGREYGREAYGGAGYGRERAGREAYRRGAAPRAPLPRPDRRRPFPLAGRGYSGPGELGRYGRAPVPYGPEHTYDYHLGDRFGYGPDYVTGEERIRQRRLPGFGARRGRRR